MIRYAKTAHAGRTPASMSTSNANRETRCFENQRWYPIKGWTANVLPTDLCGNWCDATEQPLENLSSCQLPADGAAWAGNWAQDPQG